jgi:hypothetical protein
VWAPLQAVASDASAGVNSIRFQVPEGIPAVDGYLSFKLRVNGVESNTVFLPAAL